MLGQLYLDGALVPKDVQKGVRLLSIWAVWDYDARLRLMATLAANPAATVYRPGDMLYDATEAAELGEPGARPDRSEALAERAIPRRGRRLRIGQGGAEAG